MISTFLLKFHFSSNDSVVISCWASNHKSTNQTFAFVSHSYFISKIYCWNTESSFVLHSVRVRKSKNIYINVPKTTVQLFQTEELHCKIIKHLNKLSYKISGMKVHLNVEILKNIWNCLFQQKSFVSWM